MNRQERGYGRKRQQYPDRNQKTAPVHLRLHHREADNRLLPAVGPRASALAHQCVSAAETQADTAQRLFLLRISGAGE